MYAGSGNDVIATPERTPGFYLVFVWCGPGSDRVHINPWLLGGHGCEEIF